MFLGLVPLDDLGDGDVGLDLDPLIGGGDVGVGNGLQSSFRIRFPLQDNVGRAEIVVDWAQKLCCDVTKIMSLKISSLEFRISKGGRICFKTDVPLWNCIWN